MFNNAGVGMSASVAGTPIEDHEWLMSINLDGVITGTRAFLPVLMRQGSGAIVNTSSVFGLAGIPFQSSYCAAKFAVRGFTDSLRQELRGTGVRAINVHPGGIKTAIARSAKIHEDPRGQGRTPAQLAAEFDALVQTTPERAAEVIHRGVDAGKARILIGADAHLFDIVSRLSPTHYYRVLEPLEQLASRAGARKQAKARLSRPGRSRWLRRPAPRIDDGLDDVLGHLGHRAERCAVIDGMDDELVDPAQEHHRGLEGGNDHPRRLSGR